MSLENYQTTLKYMRIMNTAMQKAQEENHKMGLPNIYSRNGPIYYEIPDGTITYKKPF